MGTITDAGRDLLAPEQPDEKGREMDRLDAALERLHQEIEKIGQRIDATMIPEGPEASLETVRSIASPLGHRIDRLEDLTGRIAGLSRRVTL